MVQEQLSKNKGASTRTKRQYLLLGLIKCGYLWRYVYWFCKQKSQKRRRNRLPPCSTKERLKTCKSQNVRGDEIESFVYYTLKKTEFLIRI